MTPEAQEKLDNLAEQLRQMAIYNVDIANQIQKSEINILALSQKVVNKSDDEDYANGYLNGLTDCLQILKPLFELAGGSRGSFKAKPMAKPAFV